MCVFPNSLEAEQKHVLHISNTENTFHNGPTNYGFNPLPYIGQWWFMLHFIFFLYPLFEGSTASFIKPYRYPAYKCTGSR